MTKSGSGKRQSNKAGRKDLGTRDGLGVQTTIYAVMFYVAAAIFAAGLALRIWQYARTPVPLKIPTTPAPVTRAGAAFRVLREVTVFESLFKSNKWIWLFGWVFHVSLALVLFRHLRYFTQPVWTLVALMQPFGVYAGFAMVAALLRFGSGAWPWPACAISAMRSIIWFCSC